MMLPLRPAEWIAIGYFGYLAVGSWFAPLSRRWRPAIQSAAAACMVVVVALAGQSAPGSLALIRDWAPALYVLIAYRVPSHLVAAIDPAAERALRAFDRRWAAGLDDRLARAPRWMVECLELAYLCCYPMLPAGFAIVHWYADAANAARVWTAVMVAAALSYGLLPWVRTRPPRQLAGPPPGRSSVRRLNTAVLDRASVQLNTFPSGHVATSMATALAVTADVPAAGVGLLLLALAIALACIAGRYHYVADVLTGAVVGALGFAMSRLS